MGIDEHTGNVVYGWRHRLKGITEAAITYHVLKVKQTNPEYDEWSMYKYLHEGNPIIFDNGSNNKVRFQKNKAQEYSTYQGKQTRQVQF